MQPLFRRTPFYVKTVGRRMLHQLTEAEKSRLREATTVMEQERRRLRQAELRAWVIYGGGSGLLTYALLNKFV